MGKTPVSAAHVQAAHALLKTARTADELRQAQSVLLPAEHGFSLGQTALAIGRSSAAVSSMRSRFCKVIDGQIAAPRSKNALRNRAYADLVQEAQVLDAVFKAMAGSSLASVTQIKAAIEAQLGHALSSASVYRMLARHGWRKRGKNSTPRWSKATSQPPA